MERKDLEATWSGRLVLMTRRASLAEPARRFDITWFLQAMHKYRGLLTEVLVASFFLQLFALITPLFFQVVGLFGSSVSLVANVANAWRCTCRPAANKSFCSCQTSAETAACRARSLTCGAVSSSLSHVSPRNLRYCSARS